MFRSKICSWYTIWYTLEPDFGSVSIDSSVGSPRAELHLIINGRPLRVLQQDVVGPLSERRTLTIASQVAAALDCAHRHGVIHRDIKPDNIILTPEGSAKVVDLGLASRADVVEDSTTVMGSANYISPEQGGGAAVDYRADLYSLGVSMFHMLTGRVPFIAPTRAEIIRQHLAAPIPDPKSFNTAISRGMADVVMKLMSKAPIDRYPSAAALNQTLNALQAASVAPPASAPAAVAPIQVVAAPPQVTHKACPYCAEQILFDAIVCKHCQRDLRPAPPIIQEIQRAAGRGHPQPQSRPQPPQSRRRWVGTRGSSAPTSAIAVAALVVSLLGAPIIGLVMGYIAMGDIRRGHSSGEGIATAAIILGWISVAIWLLLALFWFHLFGVFLVH